MSVGCTLHACPETHPCPCTLISGLRSGWFVSCDTTLHAYPPLMPANFSRVPVSVRACGRHLSHPASSFKKTKNRWNFPRKCSCAFKKKTDAWAAQARKEVAPPTTRAFDNLKTDADWQGYVSSSHFLLELLRLHSFSPAHV